MGEPSIQERLFPAFTCWGCGPANPAGLNVRSFADGHRVTATYVPRPEQGNGFGFLNGGVVCTLLDCHSAAAVCAEAERLGWAGADGGPPPYVTAGLDVRFLRPTPLSEPLALTAQVTAASEDEMTVSAELAAHGKTRATGTAVWKRWRPRS